jgi:ketosteroid isomerase-like protein
VASSGDLAYDYSTFDAAYDVGSTGKHVAWTGPALTVWKKIDGQWKIEAAFMRPYEDRAP